MLRVRGIDSSLLVAVSVNRCVAWGFTCQKPVDGTVPTAGRMVTVALPPVTSQRKVAVAPRSMVCAELVKETMTGGATRTAGFTTGGAFLFSPGELPGAGI
jgi:hypothetical protein